MEGGSDLSRAGWLFDPFGSDEQNHASWLSPSRTLRLWGNNGKSGETRWKDGPSKSPIATAIDFRRVFARRSHGDLHGSAEPPIRLV